MILHLSFDFASGRLEVEAYLALFLGTYRRLVKRLFTRYTERKHDAKLMAESKTRLQQFMIVYQNLKQREYTSEKR